MESGKLVKSVDESLIRDFVVSHKLLETKDASDINVFSTIDDNGLGKCCIASNIIIDRAINGDISMNCAKSGKELRYVTFYDYGCSVSNPDGSDTINGKKNHLSLNRDWMQYALYHSNLSLRERKLILSKYNSNIKRIFLGENYKPSNYPLQMREHFINEMMKYVIKQEDILNPKDSDLDNLLDMIFNER